MTVVRGVVREIGRSRTTRITASQWYGSTDIVIQDEETGKTYTIRLSANVMDRCKFLPRVGVPVIVHGYVEEDEYGLSDYVVTRVIDIKREGAGVKRVHKFDE
ncbi:hypothetical protein EU527_04335 [Candidatus Thorarchaeota archaeon]|nr:MAG: hypothetical protein EU527_04335 [Candidatus Thorarchaeota archaeon]